MATVPLGNGQTVKNESTVTSRWRQSNKHRLRQCIICRGQFVSAGSENRICVVCIKREAEARARPYSLDSKRKEEVQDIIDYFDEGMIERDKRARKHDSERRMAVLRKIKGLKDGT